MKAEGLFFGGGFGEKAGGNAPPGWIQCLAGIKLRPLALAGSLGVGPEEPRILAIGQLGLRILGLDSSLGHTVGGPSERDRAAAGEGNSARPEEEFQACCLFVHWYLPP